MPKESFTGKNGLTEHYYFVDLEGEYDAYTMPFMINGGKYSYFTKICTEMVTKIINVPVLKNAGTTITSCMKNLAFGSITNTARLHGPMWHDTCASACAFPPLRDKVVLNITDGMIGCFDGGRLPIHSLSVITIRFWREATRWQSTASVMIW